MSFSNNDLHYFPKWSFNLKKEFHQYCIKVTSLQLLCNKPIFQSGFPVCIQTYAYKNASSHLRAHSSVLFSIFDSVLKYHRMHPISFKAKSKSTLKYCLFNVVKGNQICPCIILIEHRVIRSINIWTRYIHDKNQGNYLLM